MAIKKRQLHVTHSHLNTLFANISLNFTSVKRVFVTILSILYLSSSIGATVDIHYCMGKSVGANFVHKQDDKCRKCGMHKSKSKGCCEDKQETFKTSEHQFVDATLHIAHTTVILPAPIRVTYGATPQNNYTSTTKTVLVNAPPNTWRTNPIYLCIRNFRI
jgi:hypothetical protein